MPDSASQAFLCELDRKLWIAADSRSAAETAGGNLRSNLDDAVYSRAERDRPTDRSARRVNVGAFINHGGTIGGIMVFGQDQWASGAHLRRAQRALRVWLRRKQLNQSNPTTWRLAAMNMAIRGIDFDSGKSTCTA